MHVGSCLRSQRQHVEPIGLGERRVISPVTNRGDCIGLPEATLQNAGDTVLALVVRRWPSHVRA